MEQKKDTNDQIVNFQITLTEANTIFKALGQMPFAEVYGLIGKLNEQANRQLENKPNNPNKQQIKKQN